MNKNDKARQEWKNFIDDFWDLIMLNILFFLSCIPVVTYGAALGALYSSVSRLREKRKNDGAAQMYWTAFKKNLKAVTPIWLVVLIALCVIIFDIAVMNTASGMGKYAYYGLLALAALIVQSFATVGIPIAVERGTELKQTITATLSVLAALPVRTCLSCILNVLPFVVLFLSNKAFAGLFLVWICLYFSLTELAISGMIKKQIRNENE